MQHAIINRYQLPRPHALYYTDHTCHCSFNLKSSRSLLNGTFNLEQTFLSQCYYLPSAVLVSGSFQHANIGRPSTTQTKEDLPVPKQRKKTNLPAHKGRK